MTPYLPPQMARCRPGKPCSQRDSCARYVVPLPAKGATVDDFSVYWVPLMFTGCNWHVGLRDFRPGDDQQARRTHPPIRGL